MNVTAKVDLLARLALRPDQWDETAEKWARTIPHDEPGNFADFLRDKIAEGVMQSYDAIFDGVRVGLLVVAVVNFSKAKEMVLVAAYGSDKRDLTAEFFPQIEALARDLGCRSVRFHTMRPGLVAKSKALGYRVSEMILRKTVA